MPRQQLRHFWNAARDTADAELLVTVKEIYRKSRNTYGVPRVLGQLRRAGIHRHQSLLGSSVTLGIETQSPRVAPRQFGAGPPFFDGSSTVPRRSVSPRSGGRGRFVRAGLRGLGVPAESFVEGGDRSMSEGGGGQDATIGQLAAGSGANPS